MKITIENKEFELDVDKALENGVLKSSRVPIVKITPGDVFKTPDGAFAPIILVKPIWSSTFDGIDKTYSFVGLDGRLEAYSNHQKLMTKEECIAELNRDKYEFHCNVNKTIEALINKA